MAYSKKMSQLSAVLAVLLLATCLGGTAWAEGSAVPGRSVGHVFLGMDRADVWKILHKPNESHTVPHGMSLYSQDDWSSSKYTLTVISERDKVIQVEFDSPRITTTDGLSTQSFWSQVRRRHPTMTVRDYVVLYEAADYQTGTSSFYIDDVRQGIAFTLETQESVEPQYVNTTKPDTIIIHRPGYRAVPINEGRWSAAIPDDDPDSMRVIRGWFTSHKGN